MQALPPPAYHCVQAADVKSGSSFLTVSGDPAQLSAFLTKAKKQPQWTVEADATAKGIRFARLRAGINIPYRSVGGLIYSAQTRHLAVAMTTDPLICENEEK